MTPRLGDFGVVRTGGWAAAVIRWATRSTVNHAFVYVGDGKIVEAQPGGAVLSDVSEYEGRTIWSTGRVVAYCDTGGCVDGVFVPDERDAIAHAARGMVGVPYNWPDIAAIGLAQRRLGRLVTPRSWIARRLSRGDRLICSQLVDAAYNAAGLHLFTDNRPTGLVSPGDLLDLIRTPERTPANG